MSTRNLTWAEVVARDVAYLRAAIDTDEKRIALGESLLQSALAAIERHETAARRYGRDEAHVSAPEATRVWETACALRIAFEPGFTPPWHEWLLALACVVRHECADAGGKDNEMYVRRVDIDSLVEHHGMPPGDIDTAAFRYALAVQRMHDFDTFTADISEYLRVAQSRRQRLGVPTEPPSPPAEEEESSEALPVLIGDRFQRHNHFGPYYPVLIVTDVIRAWPGTKDEYLLVTLRQAHWDSPRVQVKVQDLYVEYRRVG